MSEGETEQLLADFRGKSEPLGVVALHEVSQTDAARALMDWVNSLDAQTVTVARELAERAPTLLAALSASGLQVELPGLPDDVRDAPVGASLARMAIAETGSTLLSEPSLADRSVGMLTLAQAILCPTRALVASLDQVVPELRRQALAPGGSMSTLVTGPSRTADTERVLTVGVQRPGTAMVLFVDDL